MALSEMKYVVTIQSQMLVGVTGTSFNLISNFQRCKWMGCHFQSLLLVIKFQLVIVKISHSLIRRSTY